MDENRSSLQQVDSSVDVYIAPMPAINKLQAVFPNARQSEIDAVKSEKVKREKYFVWKLLEYAVNQSFNAEFSKIRFEKCNTGKWTSDLCEFSLSHGGNLVCVALSSAPVGVDIQRIQPTKTDIAKEILSAEEYAYYLSLVGEQKTAFLIGAWTKKESLFKKKNSKPLTREAFKEQDGAVFQTTIRWQDESYALSVATDTPDKVIVHKINDFLL